MSSPTPAVRAALVGLVLVTLVAIAGATLHLQSAKRDAAAAADGALRARIETLAEALAPSATHEGRLVGAFRAVSPDGATLGLALLDARGRVLTSTDENVARTIDWNAVGTADGGAMAPVVHLGGTSYRVVAQPTGAAGSRVAAFEQVDAALPEAVIFETLATAFVLWALLVGLVVLMAWYAGPRSAAHLALLGERIAQGAADGSVLIRHSKLSLGALADAFEPTAARLRQLGAQLHDRDQHVAALYQVNPHYLLLCSFDGEIVEANPAFYAATGLPIEAVRGGRVEALRETFPVEPLMDMAERSLREGSAISGIEYGIVNRDDETRPVVVSLRAFVIDGRRLVIFQATDQKHEKTLERRVAAFHDTLDLMVDQRVKQLTAGQQSLRTVLDMAGVVIASFDAGGATSRWSGGARALTGKAASAVPHFSAVSAVLGLSPAERTAFTRWFWSTSKDPFVGHHGMTDMTGETRTRQFIWQRVDADMAGRSDLRTLVGVEVPTFVDILRRPAGDGWGGGVPEAQSG